METVRLSVKDLAVNQGQIEGLPVNPRQWTKTDVDKLAKSLQETPELFEMRPCIVVPYSGKYIVLGGNMRLTAAQSLKLKDVPCIVMPENTPVDKLKEIVIKDNGTFGAWDYDMLANEWDDLPLTDWGLPVWNTEQEEVELELTSEEIQRKKKEFEERMKAGEITEEDEEYQAFLEKFEAKKTTDDCYTPEVVYEAIADYVADRYGLHRAAFVRPFYPGGDYQNERYVAGCVVVDNPPFSILSQIMTFYNEKKVKYFLFAPHLTLFSSTPGKCSVLPVGVPITYANGANVNTSFVTNLEPKELRMRTAPELYRIVKEANELNLKELHKELPKYAYDHHVITSTFMGQLSRLGIELEIPVAESVAIDKLDSQKESGKAIYGKGYLISERLYTEREKAEREKAEREKAERWELSAREREIISKL